MTKLSIAIFCFLILIIHSTATPISSIELEDKLDSNNENFLNRIKLSNDDSLWRKLFISSKSSKIPSIHAFNGNTIDINRPMNDDAQAVKSLDAGFRDALNRMIEKVNNDRSRSSSISNVKIPPRSVLSFYPKCDENSRQSEDNGNEDAENKLMNKASKFLSLYYDLRGSSVSRASNTILKSNLRVYPKKLDIDCECKLDGNENEDDQIKISLSEVLSKITFLPFKEVSKKAHIEDIKFNRCCDQVIIFDVTQLIKKWRAYPDSNNGLIIELTDNQGNKLNVNDYIQTMNCSDKSLPVPYIKMIHPKLQIDNFIQQSHYPTLDVAFTLKEDLFKLK